MKYYVDYFDTEKTKIKNYTEDSSVAESMGYTDIIEGNFNIISYKGFYYTPDMFKAIENTTEYIKEKAQLQKSGFDFESKQMETDASYIEYQGKKFSLEEILFKSLVYTPVTDLEVYLKSEDGDLVKMSRTKFLLIVAKAKANLKDTEEALYNASTNYDPTKTLEESIATLKSVLDSINKIFNS